MILTLFVGLLCFTYQAKAQWTVIDPSNLVQNIKSAVQSSTTATNMVKSLQKTTGNYMRSCEHTCCMECYDIATCDKYCKVAKDRHLQLREDKAKTEQCREERWREERKQRADKCAAHWSRRRISSA